MYRAAAYAPSDTEWRFRMLDLGFAGFPVLRLYADMTAEYVSELAVVVAVCWDAEAMPHHITDSSWSR